MNSDATQLPVISHPVLTYHDVNRKFRMGITRVMPDAFQRQMEWLSDNGYRAVPVSQIPGRQEPEKFFSITFDDVYQDLDDTALPVLQRLGFKATLVVIAGYVGQANRWEARLGGPVLYHMDWQCLQEWVKMGHEIACHGYSHRSLCGMTDDELVREVRDSKFLIEDKLGIDVEIFVPPFGRIDSRVLDVVADNGYRIVCLNSPKNFRHEGLTLVVRRGIHRFDTMRSFRRKVQLGWESIWNAWSWRITNFCSGGTILAQRGANKKIT
jgi:peptidoglycan/xylan/chitin deacetylase (PgdA/CDA1 family)